MAAYYISIIARFIYLNLFFSFIGPSVTQMGDGYDRAYTGNQEHCLGSDNLGQEVLTAPRPPSPEPCILCNGRCCPQNELFPYACVAPGICTPIYRVHHCQGYSCSLSVPCDTTGVGCCPDEQICRGNDAPQCCPPDDNVFSHVCLAGTCYRYLTAHFCGSATCPLHIPCDTTGEGCCPTLRLCGPSGETCCPPGNATFNFECDPASQSCTAIRRCNHSDNPCRNGTCMDDGYCCPDALACNTICCMPPQVPLVSPPWGCADRNRSICCPSDNMAADDGKCCPVEQILLLRDPTRVVCCIPPEKPYNAQCSSQNESCKIQR